MTLTFSAQPAIVMIHTHAKGQRQRSVCSTDRVETKPVLIGDLAAADLLSEVAGFQRLRERLAKLLGTVDGRQPEAERGGVVVARAAAVTLDERRSAERLEARAGRVEWLAGPVRTSTRVLHRHTPPAHRPFSV